VSAVSAVSQLRAASGVVRVRCRSPARGVGGHGVFAAILDHDAVGPGGIEGIGQDGGDEVGADGGGEHRVHDRVVSSHVRITFVGEHGEELGGGRVALEFRQVEESDDMGSG
jgi:hypothetical protein